VTPWDMVSTARLGAVTGKPYGVLSSSLAGTDGRIVAKVALDVGDNDVTVDAISRHKPLTSDVAIRHGARRAQRACVWERWRDYG
jgi:hypothetical protein